MFLLRRYLVSFLLVIIVTESLSLVPGVGDWSRRQALQIILKTSGLWLPPNANANDDDPDDKLSSHMVIRSRGIKDGATTVDYVPRVGYSLYKIDKFQAAYCVQLALKAGVRHFDCAAAYNTNEQVGDVLPEYLYKGNGKEQGGLSKQERRDQLFVAHKVSNAQQSTNRANVKKSVKDDLTKLGVGYLDLCYIHSPLTDPQRRLSTYEALMELQHEGTIRNVGVANYGVNPLDEIVNAGMPTPAVIQLELSPFNQHLDVVDWAKSHSTIVSCASWSMLNTPSGPTQGWKVLEDLAESKGMTPAQVLIRWACQSGHLCVPRSGSKKQAQRDAIRDNAFPVVKNLKLTEKDMAVLNSLNVNYPAGSLGRRDGWTKNDVTDPSWDPTLVV